MFLQVRVSAGNTCNKRKQPGEIMDPTRKSILLTRPTAQSLQFSHVLKQRFGSDIAVEISPLLEIIPVQQSWDLAQVHTLVFTSINGVKAFAQQHSNRDLPCICVGDRTADAAQKFGFLAKSAAGNASDLIAMIIEQETPTGGHYLHVRGKEVAFDVAQALRDLGIAAQQVVAYEQTEVLLTKAAAAILSGVRPVIAPLFSPRTAAYFSRQTSHLDLSQATALCLSVNVADRLEQSRFAKLVVAEKPDATAMMTALAVII